MSDATAKSCPFLIRAAGTADLPLIRAWLPVTLRGSPPPLFAVATEAASAAVAGIAALRMFGDGVGRFRLFVDPPFRRRGCGTLLLERIRLAAGRFQMKVLLTGASYPAEPQDQEGQAAVAFFRAHGLTVMLDILRYRAAGTGALLALLEPLYQRWAQRASGSPLCIVTADQVEPRLLADFAVRHVGGFAEDVAARLTGQGVAYSPALSMVALAGNRIVGAQLSVAQGSSAFVETRAVEADFRGGGVNLALLYHALAAGARLGIQAIEFEGEARDRDTTKLARRLAATPVGRRQCWGCSIRATAPATPPQR